jgi:hypothetical protein
MGAEIITVLPRIVAAAGDISCIRILRMAYPPPMSERLTDHRSCDYFISRGQIFSQQHSLPFWSSVLLTAQASYADVPQRLFDAARFHRPATASARSATVNADDLTPESLQRRLDALESNEFLMVSSQVLTRDGVSMHLPLLDLSIPYSTRNTRLARRAVESLGIPGVLFKTERSYHFYGVRLLSEDEYLHTFLGQALLFAPLTDQRWIAHQLLDGFAVLGLSRRSASKSIPVAVAAVDLSSRPVPSSNRTAAAKGPAGN